MGRKIGGFGGGLYAVLNLIGGIIFCALVGPKKGFFGGTGAGRVLMGGSLVGVAVPIVINHKKIFHPYPLPFPDFTSPAIGLLIGFFGALIILVLHDALNETKDEKKKEEKT